MRGRRRDCDRSVPRPVPGLRLAAAARPQRHAVDTVGPRATAATEHGARVPRTADTGRLTVGSRADFILYRGDVERGPFEMARVLEVAKDGVRFVAGGRRVAN